MEKQGETITAEEERCCCVQETQRLLEEQLPAAGQEDQNSRRSLRKLCGKFAQDPPNGGPVFAGKCPRSMGAQWSPSLHRLQPTNLLGHYSSFRGPFRILAAGQEVPSANFRGTCVSSFASANLPRRMVCKICFREYWRRKEENKKTSSGEYVILRSRTLA